MQRKFFRFAADTLDDLHHTNKKHKRARITTPIHIEFVRFACEFARNHGFPWGPLEPSGAHRCTPSCTFQRLGAQNDVYLCLVSGILHFCDGASCETHTTSGNAVVCFVSGRRLKQRLNNDDYWWHNFRNVRCVGRAAHARYAKQGRLPEAIRKTNDTFRVSLERVLRKRVRDRIHATLKQVLFGAKRQLCSRQRMEGLQARHTSRAMRLLTTEFARSGRLDPVLAAREFCTFQQAWREHNAVLNMDASDRRRLVSRLSKKIMDWWIAFEHSSDGTDNNSNDSRCIPSTTGPATSRQQQQQQQATPKYRYNAIYHTLAALNALAHGLYYWGVSILATDPLVRLLFPSERLVRDLGFHQGTMTFHCNAFKRRFIKFVVRRGTERGRPSANKRRIHTSSEATTTMTRKKKKKKTGPKISIPIFQSL